MTISPRRFKPEGGSSRPGPDLAGPPPAPNIYDAGRVCCSLSRNLIDSSAWGKYNFLSISDNHSDSRMRLVRNIGTEGGTEPGTQAHGSGPRRREREIMNAGRRSIRLPDYDYAQAGSYFITICTQGRACLFGDAADGRMVLNDAGRMAEKCWMDIPDHFPHVELDLFIVMPNHVHGILVIVDSVGAKDFSPLPGNVIITNISSVTKKN